MPPTPKIDRHRIWRAVNNNIAHLEQHAPDGYEVVIDVYLFNRIEPVRIGVVETTRDDWPWTLLQTFAAGKEPSGKYDADVRLVFVPENLVERVEISYQRSTGETLGFGHRITGEPSA
jgi:hypothetical protein